MRCSLALVAILSQCVAYAQEKPPSFVIMLVDDLGYADLSVPPFTDNRGISTPYLEKMAAEGITLTQAIAGAPVCTPSRAALLTGRLPVRSGMAHNQLRVLPGGFSAGHLPDSELTLAEALKEKGYRTAISGKWHLGTNEKDRDDGKGLPAAHGFDHSLVMSFSNNPGCEEGNEDGFWCFMYEDTNIIQQPIQMENSTVHFTKFAVEFLRDAVRTDDPFFLFLSWSNVHTALHASPQFKGKSKAGFFGDNVEEVDWSAGQVLQTLQELGVDEDTFVVFTSDNGNYAEEGDHGGHSRATTMPLTGSKGQTFEGGIRVPMIARWPGSIPGNTTSNAAVSLMDMYPTMLNLAGVPLPEDRIIDGKDMMPVLTGISARSAHDVMWHYCGVNVTAARHGDIKIHFATPIWTSDFLPNPPCQQCCPRELAPVGVCGCTGNMVHFHDPPLMFNIANDPAEQIPLTPDNFEDFDLEVMYVKKALAEHYATVEPVENQMTKAIKPVKLNPCCNWPTCECDDFDPEAPFRSFRK